MKPILPLLFLTAALVFNACQKGYYEESVESIYDADAQKFIDSAGVTDVTQKTALNDFVLQLKTSSLWPKFMAIYPMIGGTEQSVKWNLKDPENTDLAFRLTMYGSPVYSPSGVLFPTADDYADTHFADDMVPYNDNSIAYYSSTQNTVSGYDMGCVDNIAPENEMAIYESSDASNWDGFYQWGNKPTVTTGLFIFSSSATDVKRYDNGVVTSSKGSAPISTAFSWPILIGKVANINTNGQRQCQLATIGHSLSDSDAVNFCKIANAFQAKLGR